MRLCVELVFSLPFLLVLCECTINIQSLPELELKCFETVNLSRQIMETNAWSGTGCPWMGDCVSEHLLLHTNPVSRRTKVRRCAMHLEIKCVIYEDF